MEEVICFSGGGWSDEFGTDMPPRSIREGTGSDDGRQLEQKTQLQVHDGYTAA